MMIHDDYLGHFDIRFSMHVVEAKFITLSLGFQPLRIDQSLKDTKRPENPKPVRSGEFWDELFGMILESKFILFGFILSYCIPKLNSIYTR